MSKYLKLCYWVGHKDLKRVKEQFEQKGEVFNEETRIPCRMLKTSIRIGCIVPEAWESFCKRKTSWYPDSDKAGQSLVVSNVSLNHLDIGNPIVIKTSTFKPERFPSYEEILRLTDSEQYQKLKPFLWEHVDPLERTFYRRWFSRYRPDETFDFEKLFAYHSANHANFIDPKFSIDVNGKKAPYSIAGSIHICSSCLEFFNILGDQWSVKYVVPCLGAVQFAHLPMDQYFKVMSANRIDPNQTD